MREKSSPFFKKKKTRSVVFKDLVGFKDSSDT